MTRRRWSWSVQQLSPQKKTGYAQAIIERRGQLVAIQLRDLLAGDRLLETLMP